MARRSRRTRARIRRAARKVRRRFSAAQLAAQRRFAAMARRRAKSRRRKTRTRRRLAASSQGAQPVARRRRSTRRYTRRRRSYRRGGSASVSLRGFTSPAMLKTVVGTAAGFVGANMLVDRLPVDTLKYGRGRIAGKALIGIAGAMLLRRIGGGQLAAALGTGALVAAAIDAYNEFGPGGAAGMGYLIDNGAGPQYLLNGYGGVAAYGQGIEYNSTATDGVAY